MSTMRLKLYNRKTQSYLPTIRLVLVAGLLIATGEVWVCTHAQEPPPTIPIPPSSPLPLPSPLPLLGTESQPVITERDFEQLNLPEVPVRGKAITVTYKVNTGQQEATSQVQLPPIPSPQIALPQLQLPQVPLPQVALTQVPLPSDATVDPPAIAGTADATVETATAVPVLAEPYWVALIKQSSQPGFQPLVYDQAVWDALAHSPYVKAVQIVPQISQSKINEASGLFDPTPFVDSIFNDSSDPVGSTLATGGPKRLNEHKLDNGVGLRAKNQLGGSAELAQNMQLRNNNSVFLSPKEQADAKMLLKLNQPLMRGAGRTYATSSVRIAELNVGVSQYEATRKLQLHTQSIASAYWNLFAARSIEIQAERGRQRLIYLRDELAKRARVDGLESQLKRAEAAIARQSSSIARARADVTSATANLRALVNSPELAGNAAGVMPVSAPVDEPFAVNRTSELEAALAFHPDLQAARERLKSATIRLKVAENELRPTLNLVMEGYLHGLNGNYGLGDSLVDQFSTGRPSYSGGLSYQRPYRNVISKSILQQRRLEIRQLLLELDNTMLVVSADVDQAIAAVEATYAELEAAVKSTMAFDEEVRYLDGRWQNSFVESTGPSLLLDELLNAQNQLIQAENAWARAQAEHMIAFAKLHVATGTMLSTVSLGPLE